ncbi:hypothetical protein CC1G_09282 [Coprinopsis cinerea okayama7|uniref:Beta-lactamase-related domain-containing protein n=1 Tax=Coprinopsis cinerea (strain Okayama-7 / 130 / ATCC MYA-4618 / FGSC 9003) TaxID=240176 RepID=A8N861_COPC7|nr:hypothetical protein CC1G_09282 [Coprinopsis cinerea okayama7\|eukprot:XP_001831017.1 hypothetical protein CC1G_09282 [Coprinopsis cinerea okayama7\
MKKYWLSKNLLLVSLLIADCTSIGYGIQLDWDTTGLAGTGVVWGDGVGRTTASSDSRKVTASDSGKPIRRHRRRPRNTPRNSTSPLISDESKSYIDWLLNEEWNSTGLGVAVVQKLPPSPSDNNTTNGLPRWKVEFASFGSAQTSIIPPKPVTPDTLFAIASNSKLFLSLSVGMLLHNHTLASEFQNKTGKRLGWGTKMVDLLGEDLWRMWDEDTTRGATVLDLLLHRTGLPRHDFSGTGRREGGVRGVIETLHSLRPSASFRLTTQYNNLMYETLSYLPQVLLNQSYESYVHQQLLAPLNMSSTFFDVGLVQKGEEFGDRMAEGHLADMRDFRRGRKGVLKPVVPYFFRPGEEKVWAGAGGLISSPRDMFPPNFATWVAMLLNDGRHPYTNAVVVPKEVLDFVSTGRVVTHGTPEFPEFSPKVYGPAQWRYTYQGLDIIEHGGNNAGFKSQVARFPSARRSQRNPNNGLADGAEGLAVGGLADGDLAGGGLADGGLADGGLADGGLADGGLAGGGLAVVSLSNDGEHGGFVLEAAKWRIVEDVFGLREVDWSARCSYICRRAHTPLPTIDRYKQLWNDYQDKVRREALPRPPNKDQPTTRAAPSHAPPKHPTTRGELSRESFVRLGQLKFSHPAYGELTPCLVPGSLEVEGVAFGRRAQEEDGDGDYAFVDEEGEGQVPFGHAHASSGQDVESFPNPYVDCGSVLGGADARRVLGYLARSSRQGSESPKTFGSTRSTDRANTDASANHSTHSPSVSYTEYTTPAYNTPTYNTPAYNTPTYNTPTYLIPFPRTFASHLVLTHYEGMVFNVSVVWGNAGLRGSVGMNQAVDGEEEEDRGAILIGLDEHFEVEWFVPPGRQKGYERGGSKGRERVQLRHQGRSERAHHRGRSDNGQREAGGNGDEEGWDQEGWDEEGWNQNENDPASLNLDEPPEEGRGGGGGWDTEGLSFKRGFWGREGMDSEEPADGLGRGSAEVWFGVV